MNSIQRQIQPLNHQIGYNVNSIQRQIQPLNPQRQIQPLNTQIGLPFKDRLNHLTHK